MNAIWEWSEVLSEKSSLHFKKAFYNYFFLMFKYEHTLTTIAQVSISTT